MKKTLESARRHTGQIVAAQVDGVHVEDAAKRVAAHVAHARVHQTQPLDVVGAHERARLNVLDVSVREQQRLAVREAAEGVCGQLTRRYALHVDLIDERRRYERVVLNGLDGRVVLAQRDQQVAHVSQAVKRVTLYPLFAYIHMHINRYSKNQSNKPVFIFYITNLDGISDEVDYSNRTTAAENEALDGVEAVHAQRQVVEIEEAAERVRLELD